MPNANGSRREPLLRARLRFRFTRSCDRELLTNGDHGLVLSSDRAGMEVFATGGRTYVPMPFIPKADDRSLAVQVTGSPVYFTQLQTYELKSAW